MPALALPAFWGAVGATAAGTGAIVGAKIQSSANTKAAKLQAQGADKALTFQQSEAARDQGNFETTQHANYDQWAARERRLGSLDDYLGYGGRDIPPYVSTAMPASGPAPSGKAVPGGNFQQWFMSQIAGKPFNQQTLLDLEPTLAQYGSRLTPPNSVGERTKIFDPTTGQWVRVGFGEGKPVWIPQGSASGPRKTMNPYGAIASYLEPSASPSATPRVPIAPALTMPYALQPFGAYLGA